MKRISAVCSAAFCFAALALSATQGFAHESHGKGSHMNMGSHTNMGGASKTITGEVVDTGCYLGSGERGAKHVSCATKCIDQGMPMGLLTAGGKLYLLTLDHDDAGPYNDIKKMAGKMVSVTGSVMSRSGMTAIDVTAFTPVSATSTK